MGVRLSAAGPELRDDAHGRGRLRLLLPAARAGTVGRLIVGKATGPGTLPFDYFKAEETHWKSVPPAAQKTFPGIDDILRRKVVPSPLTFAA